MASVRISFDGGAWRQATGTTTWSSSWDTTGLANGSHTVAAQAIDSAGNVSPTVRTQVTVANGPAPITTCSDGASVIEQTVTPEGVRITICTAVGGWTTQHWSPWPPSPGFCSTRTALPPSSSWW